MPPTYCKPNGTVRSPPRTRRLQGAAATRRRGSTSKWERILLKNFILLRKWSLPESGASSLIGWRGTYTISLCAQKSGVDKRIKEGFPLKEVYGFPDIR